MIAVSGGCQCGTHRFDAQVLPGSGYWCHCRMCQRATGGVAAAFVNAAKVDVRWQAAPPVTFMSSPIGRRGFCEKCGTPLTFDYPDSDRVDLTMGSLDNPGAVRLASHFGVESRVPDWIPHDDLPVTRCEEHEPLVARWNGATGGPE